MSRGALSDPIPDPPGPVERRLRVLVVSLGRRGGVTTYGRLMAGGLARHCDVAAIFSAMAEDSDRWKSVGFPHLAVKTFSGVASMALSFLAFGRFVRITRFARDFAPDVVYYPGGHVWKPVLELLMPKRAITVLTIHDPMLHVGEDSLSHRMFAAMNRMHVDGYVLLNEAQRVPYATQHRIALQRVTVLPHGIFDHVVEAREDLAMVPSLAHLASLAGTFVLFVGRIQRYKGIDVLLDAYRRIVDGCRMPLVIAGSGRFSESEREALAELGNNVSVVNAWLSDTEIASLVDAARFVVLPYTSATQSGVIPLASAFGTPAIASDAGSVAEQIVDGETGLLVPAGDVAKLVAALQKACAMPELEYERMSRACRDHARAEWDWEVLAGRLVGFFETLKAAHEKREAIDAAVKEPYSAERGE